MLYFTVTVLIFTQPDDALSRAVTLNHTTQLNTLQRLPNDAAYLITPSLDVLDLHPAIFNQELCFCARLYIIYKHDHQHNTTRWSCRTISDVGNQKKKTKSVLTVYLLMYIAHSSVNTFEFAKTKKSLSRRR